MSILFFGSSGGTGGAAFDDQMDLNLREDDSIFEVKINHGDRIDGIQTKFNGPNGPESVRHGGSGGDEDTFSVPAGQRIVAISGEVVTILVPAVGGARASTRVGKISFITTDGHDHPFGRGAGANVVASTPFQYNRIPNSEIIGFIGRSGSELDCIGVVYRVPDPLPPQPSPP